MTELLFVGLGNVGPAYEHTRHNLGIRALRFWIRQQAERGLLSKDWREDIDLFWQHAEVSFENVRVHGAFPLTNMNNSGKAVVAFLKYHSIEQNNILVIHDDVELPLGEVKIKTGGSAGGHNGVRSVHQSLGTQDIPRLRLGVGRPPAGLELDAYVLTSFAEAEHSAVEEMVRMASDTLTNYITERQRPE